MFENPRRGEQARNFTTNVPKILDLKSSSEQIFSRKLSLGAPVWCENDFLCLSDWRELVAVTISRQKLGVALGSSLPSSDFSVVMQKKLIFRRKLFSLAYFESESFGTRKWPTGIEEMKVSQTSLSFTFSHSAMKACDHSLIGTKYTCFTLAM